MKKIIPFQKKISFNTNVSEITSIALENTLKSDNNKIEGELIINGSYKITDTSIKTDEFEFKIPVNIEIDDKYITQEIMIDIDDFYYEIINNNILEVNIDIMLDNLIERQIEKQEEQIKKNEEEKEKKKVNEQIEILKSNEEVEQKKTTIKEERCIEEEISETIQEKPIEETNIFSNFNNENEEYTTYYVYIVREGDTIENIITKYKTTKENLIEYNDITELKLGDKLIIPKINV